VQKEVPSLLKIYAIDEPVPEVGPTTVIFGRNRCTIDGLVTFTGASYSEETVLEVRQGKN
jgi:hypothetical protein